MVGAQKTGMPTNVDTEKQTHEVSDGKENSLGIGHLSGKEFVYILSVS
jgi:hypothetical protein